MLRNYIILAIRGFLKNKAHTLINIVGLTIGIGSFILIMLFIREEMSFDRYHPNADRIFRIHNTLNLAEGDYPYPTCNSALPLRAAEEIPEVESMVRLVKMGTGFNPAVILRVNDGIFKETNTYFADSTFFEIFSGKFLQGDPRTALEGPNKIVLTQSAASRLFRQEDPMGKTVTMLGQPEISFLVTGIVEDTPVKTHLTYTMLFSMSTVDRLPPDGNNGGNANVKFSDNWNGDGFYSYLLLRNRNDKAKVEEGLRQLVSKYVKTEDQDMHSPVLFPLTRIHLYSNLRNELQPNGNIQQIYVFLVVAIVILLIASINYINLSTAIASRRAREVGIRKVFGASRKILVSQFIGESVLLTVISTFLAIIFVDLMMPVLNSLTGQDTTMRSLSDPYMIAMLLGIVLFIGFLSGSYPSLVISSFQPTQVLRGIDRKGRNISQNLRQVLVVFQFTISLMLIISAWNIYRQIRYVRNKPLGYQKENILVIENNNNTLTPKFNDFRAELLQSPGIEEVAASLSVPGGLRPIIPVTSDSVDTDANLTAAGINVTFEYLNALRIPIREGRDFDPQNGLDSNESVIVNLKAARLLKLGSQPIGKTISLNMGDNKPHKRTVIGIVDDVNFEPLYRPTEAAIYGHLVPFFPYVFVRLDGVHNREALDYIRFKWEDFVPGEPFTYEFLDRSLDNLYDKEDKMGEIVTYFTILAVLIAILGLYGLSSYSILQRSKEIGIRRTLGASLPDILYLFSSSYMLLVLIATAVAWPLTWFFLSKWMENFIYHTRITWIAFLAGCAIVMLMAQLTVLLKVFQISRIDPVRTLKYE